MEHTENSSHENKTPETNSKKTYFKSSKIKIISSVVAVFILISAIGGVVWAKKKFRDGPHGFLMGRIVEKLNLNDNQKAQVEKIKDQIKERMEAKKGNRENIMDEFANEFKKDNLDKSKLSELDQKRTQNEQEMKDFMMDKLIEFHNILTPEQRLKAAETMLEMKNKFHDRGDRKEKNDNRKNRED